MDGDHVPKASAVQEPVTAWKLLWAWAKGRMVERGLRAVQRLSMAAVVRKITKKERKAERRAEFRIVCKGVSKAEFRALYDVFGKVFGCKTVLRNPFPPAFDAKAVHEIITHVTGTAIGGYATKKVIDAAHDLFVAYVKYKFMTGLDGGRTRDVTLYGPDGIVGNWKSKKPKTDKVSFTSPRRSARGPSGLALRSECVVRQQMANGLVGASQNENDGRLLHGQQPGWMTARLLRSALPRRNSFSPWSKFRAGVSANYEMRLQTSLGAHTHVDYAALATAIASTIMRSMCHSPAQRLEKKAKLNRTELQQVPHLLQIFFAECSCVRFDVYVVKIGKSPLQRRRHSPDVALLQWQGCDLRSNHAARINILQHCEGKSDVWLHVLRRCKLVCPVFVDDISDRDHVSLTYGHGCRLRRRV